MDDSISLTYMLTTKTQSETLSAVHIWKIVRNEDQQLTSFIEIVKQ